MNHEEIHLRLIGRMLFLAYEDEQDIRLAHIDGCDFEFNGADHGVEAALWLAGELRKRGVEIRGRRSWAGSRRRIRTHKIPAQVGILTVELARNLDTDKVLSQAKLHGFDSTSCDKFKGGALFQLVWEFISRAGVMMCWEECTRTIFHDMHSDGQRRVGA